MAAQVHRDEVEAVLQPVHHRLQQKTCCAHPWIRRIGGQARSPAVT